MKIEPLPNCSSWCARIPDQESDWEEDKKITKEHTTNEKGCIECSAIERLNADGCCQDCYDRENSDSWSMEGGGLGEDVETALSVLEAGYDENSLDWDNEGGGAHWEVVESAFDIARMIQNYDLGEMERGAVIQLYTLLEDLDTVDEELFSKGALQKVFKKIEAEKVKEILKKIVEKGNSKGFCEIVDANFTDKKYADKIKKEMMIIRL